MKNNYHIFQPGTLERAENTLRFEPDSDDERQYIPVSDVECIFAHEPVRTNTKLYKFLNENNIALHVFTWGGRYAGAFLPTKASTSGSTVVSQVDAYQHPERRRNIATEFVVSSIHNMRQNVEYYDGRGHDVEDIADRLSQVRDDVDANTPLSIEELLGKEAEARKAYYRLFAQVTPEAFEFSSREYNPPTDKLNALISFSNSLLYGTTTSAIRSTALEPSISYLHEPGDRRNSLSMDIADVFKPVIVDRTILRTVNRNQLSDDEFRWEDEACLLTESGRKTITREFETMLDETVAHPDLDRHVSYQYLIRLEVYALKKHLLADEPYDGFKRWW